MHAPDIGALRVWQMRIGLLPGICHIFFKISRTQL